MCVLKFYEGDYMNFKKFNKFMILILVIITFFSFNITVPYADETNENEIGLMMAGVQKGGTKHD